MHTCDCIVVAERPLLGESELHGDFGRDERRLILEKRIPGIDRVLETEIDDVPLAHLLDAAALLWTARRIFARAGTRLPTEPEWDEEGLRMEFVR